MNPSKRTKRGRAARRRRVFVIEAGEAMAAHQGRRLRAWMQAQMRASSSPQIRAEASRVQYVVIAAGGGC